MQKFYLKIEKRDVNHERRSWGRRGSYMKKGTEVFLALCSMFGWKRAAEHIPAGLRRGGPAWNWNTNGPGDGQARWDAEEEEEECVWTLSCFLTVWKVVIWDWARQNWSSDGSTWNLCCCFFFFFPTDSIFYLPAQNHLFHFVYSKHYIYKFNLFI